MCLIHFLRSSGEQNCMYFLITYVSIRSVLTNDWNQFPWINVSRVRLLNITCPVNFKPAVIRWPEVANAFVGTFLRGDTALWEVRQGWAGQCWSCPGLQSDWMCTTFHAKINDLLWYCLRWNVKQPGEVCVGGGNTRFNLIITCVYSWNTQKQEGQLNLMKMKVPQSYNT